MFLDSDRVNFQKEGYQKEELLAGLAQVLPKNVWQYVVQIPRLASLGTRFVLQGGTQYNLAAVKAQVDYIKQRVPGGQVFVHPHTGEAGAIGAAIETLRRYKRSGVTRFIGIEAALNLEYKTKNDEETVCHFCPNECKRTFIDTTRPDGSSTRYISGFSCEKGTVESKDAMLSLMEERRKTAAAFPNIVNYEGERAFVHFYEWAPMPAAGTPVEDVKVTKTLFRVKREAITRPFLRSSEDAWKRRKKIRVGLPRVLNMYSTAPFFRTYFEALGVGKSNVVWSDATTEETWVEGGKYGSIDPCFPSKVVQSHIHNLLFHKHEPERNKGLNYIFFPILTHVNNFVVDTQDNASCPIVAGTPDVTKAAFTKEVDFFAVRNMEYLDPALSFEEPTLLARRMFETWKDRLEITEDENDHACKEAWKALKAFDLDLQDKGRAILETVEAEDRIAILVLNRPYHADPGLNHGIPDEFQVLGYPILSIRSIPKDREYLDRYYKDELERGVIKSPLEINHVWPENYSVNSAMKVWAAAFAAHHPNVAVLESIELQVRPRRADLRPDRRHHPNLEDALGRATRHRRQQTGRLDQDPRQDLRAFLALGPRALGRFGRQEARDGALHREEAARVTRAEASPTRRPKATRPGDREANRRDHGARARLRVTTRRRGRSAEGRVSFGTQASRRLDRRDRPVAKDDTSRGRARGRVTPTRRTPTFLIFRANSQILGR